MAVTGEQIRAGRALARWEQTDLARNAEISVETIRRLEAVRGPVSANVKTLDAIEAAFRSAGVVFINPNGGGPGVRLAE